MISNKALGAIALTLIVACPIGLGYVFALEQEEVTVWESTSKASLTDIMLNSNTEYYINWEGPTNNSQLYYKSWHSGYQDNFITAPDYESVSNTYTSIPIYEEISGSYPILPFDTISVPVNVSSEYDGVQSPGYGDPSLYELPVSDYYYIMRGYGTEALLMMDQDGSAPTHVTTERFLHIIRDGPGSWTVIAEGNTYESVEAFYVKPITSDTLTAYCSYYTPIELDGDYSFFSPAGLPGVKIVHDDGSVEYVVGWDQPYDQSNLLKTSRGDLYIDDLVFGSVSELYIVGPTNIGGFSYNATAPVEGEYADMSAGWTVSKPSDPFAPYWYNGQVNASVSMSLHIEEDRELFLEPVTTLTDDDTAPWLRITREGDGLVTVTHGFGGEEVSVVLGEYSDIYMTMSGDAYIVSGLASWPAMGTAPSTLHTVTLEHDMLLDDFRFVEIAVPGDHYEDVRLRVDSAQIVAGTFPLTEDYTLDMNTLFPARSYSIDIHSIGVYGDSLTLAGVSLPVTNGTVTVNDRTIALRGADISCIDRDGDGIYVTSIGTEEVGTTTGPGSIYLEGEWSLTATAYMLEEVTSTQLRWQPGEFGFDETGFVIIGLIACLGAFVGLGMYGRRSGAKVGILMLICGGAAMVLLMMV